MFLANSHGVWDCSLPVHRRKADSRLIEDIVFTSQMNPMFLMKSIKTAYGSSPFYEHFEEGLGELFNKYGNPRQSLLEFNLQTIRWVEEELGIKSIKISSKYVNCDDEIDFRIKSKLTCNKWKYKPYPQVFEDRNGFIDGRSILDAIFHGGAEAKRWWTSVSLQS